MSVGFELIARDGDARAGRVTTAHGVFETPAFMPVGTAATVKAMAPADLRRVGAEILLANTYHLMLRPGAERLERLGGLHRFMNWEGPILTDSGGFQVLSLAKRREVREDGVAFRSHLDGALWDLTPERAVAIQKSLGADIAMVLDECPPFPIEKGRVAESTARSMRWAARSKAAFEVREGHGLFGINQGGVYEDLRAESAEALTSIGFDGYGVGGLAVGEGQEQMFAVLDHVVPLFPRDKPRYLMGVGKPEDLLGAVARGIDMFDCVLPTRSGRTGQAFTHRGSVNLRNARHADDPRPLDEACGCATCGGYSRAYLNHLVRADEILSAMLLTAHNLHFYLRLMRGMGEAIQERRFTDFKAGFEAELAKGDIAPV
ncbi:MAG: tRNA guanosine(34) transglycosylase Tgt [Proteobacteria bacterium]|nr:tRNA guanosine(34) transglycosylase Tgt [Pseudomonadota bacterium]